MIFLAILAALVIAAVGFVLGIIVPRWVSWEYRSATMLVIWFMTLILAGVACWEIAA